MDEQLKREVLDATWEARQRERAARLGRRKGAGRKPNMPTLPPPPTDAEWRVWLALDAAKAVRAGRRVIRPPRGTL